MSRGRPRHQSSRRRMYSPRQRDLRERRVHHQVDEYRATEREAAPDIEEGAEFDAPSGWGMQLQSRGSAA
ncbi:MAG: hypothetical protein M3R32_03245 [Chloroflexota bacterium]|nr:hypothetical protein [Chloroflexota bacterium]